MKELRSLALQSLPDSPGIRSTVWKVGITRIMVMFCFHLEISLQKSESISW